MQASAALRAGVEGACALGLARYKYLGKLGSLGGLGSLGSWGSVRNLRAWNLRDGPDGGRQVGVRPAGQQASRRAGAAP